MKREPIVLRRSDHALFEPSSPDHWSDGDALASLFDGGPSYYFRRVVWAPYQFWFGGRFVRTGEIWEPKDEAEFDVIDHKLAAAGAKELARRHA